MLLLQVEGPLCRRRREGPERHATQAGGTGDRGVFDVNRGRRRSEELPVEEREEVWERGRRRIGREGGQNG